MRRRAAFRHGRITKEQNQGGCFRLTRQQNVMGVLLSKSFGLVGKGTLAERGPISVISAIRKIRNPLVLFSARPIRPHCAASYGIPKFRDEKRNHYRMPGMPTWLAWPNSQTHPMS
jgi:hypothetical protein